MLDAHARVTGSVEYLVNLRLPDMLTARVVRSTVPHGRLLPIDAAEARRIPGVAAVVTAENLPTRKLYGVQIADQPVIALDRVRFAGEPVALIAAEDHDACEEAAYALVPEIEELPAVFDALEAVHPGAPTLHERFPNNIFKHTRLVHGDVESAFSGCDAVFEDTFTSPVAQQASLEPHVAAAQWQGDRLTVWTAAQAPFNVRAVLAHLFDLPEDHIRIIVHPLGGGYGGKGHVRIEPMVAALARLTGDRPVKLVLSREEEFVTVTKHAASITLKTGVRSDGSLVARRITAHWNSGAYADAGALLIQGGMLRSVGPYRFEAVEADSYGIYTNLPPAAAFRGAMSSQATWAYESQMDMIARRIGRDPFEFRMQNLLEEGDHFATGEVMHDVHFKACLEEAAAQIGWQAHPKPSPAGPLRYGRGLGVMMKSTIATSRSECRLRFDDRGAATLFTSTVEMGQGAHTALAQIAADALALPFEQMQVQGPDTAQTPYDATTSASRSTNMMGNAVIAAAGDLLRQLKEHAQPLMETPTQDLSAHDGFLIAPDGASLSYQEVLRRNGLQTLEASGAFATRLGIDPETGQGISTPHWHQGAGAVELSVDIETGKITLLRYGATSFAGRVVNPALARLQNDGNVIFGLGPALMEEVLFDAGTVTNPNLSDYLIPSIRDLPLELKSLALESDRGELHGIGEMTLPPVAPAIAAAVEDAAGVRITSLPITAEKILRALSEKEEGWS